MTARQLPLFPTDSEHALTRNSAIEEAVPPFLEYLRREGRSEHTIKSFASDLKLVIEYFGADIQLKTFTTTRLNRFLHWLEHERGVPCSQKSYARRVTTLKVFFKFLRAERILTHDPADALLQRSGPAPLQPVLSDKDIRRLMAEATARRLAEEPDARPALLLHLLLETGIKKSECMRLTLADIDAHDAGHPQIAVRHKKPSNVYQERQIAVSPEWMDILREYRVQYQPKETLFECTARNLEYILHDLAQSAGLTSRVSFEILRWTSAVQDYRRGMELDELREKMGLSRISWRETKQKIIQLAARLDQTASGEQ